MFAPMFRIFWLFRREEYGVAAVEMGLVAPVLMLAVVTMSDLGFAIHERLEIDQALRNGAQRAITDPGETAVAAVLTLIEPTGAGMSSTTFTVDRYCACAETPTSEATCSTTCADNKPTSIFYELTGRREFTGFLMSTETITRTSVIQVR